MSIDTNACTYAALILNDTGLPMTSENIMKVTAAAGIDVKPTLPILFARYLEANGMDSLIAAASSGGAADAPPAATTAAAPAAAAPAKAAAKAPAKKPESDDDDDACTYATLILNDTGLPMTSENIMKVTAAAGIDVKPTLPILFGRYLEVNGMDSLIAASSSGGAADTPCRQPSR